MSPVFLPHTGASFAILVLSLFQQPRKRHSIFTSSVVIGCKECLIILNTDIFFGKKRGSIEHTNNMKEIR
jgi:hypothetical protein